MAHSTSNAIEFVVSEDGICTEVNWSKNHFDDDKIVLILDELNKTVWLYHGKRNGLVKRRKALRQAESLRNHGYQVGKTIIGRQLEKIKEIDARLLDRVPEAKKDYEDLISLFDLPFKVVDGECVALDKDGSSDIEARQVRVPAPKPTAEMLKTVVSKTPAPKPMPVTESKEVLVVDEQVLQQQAAIDHSARPPLQGKAPCQLQCRTD